MPSSGQQRLHMDGGWSYDSEEEAAQLQAYYERHTAVAFDLMTLNFAELGSIPALKPAIRAFFDVEEPPTDEAPWSEIFIEGEDAPNGIYDPSMEYGPDGVGWMAYSALKAGKDSRVETRIARSDDNGRTWRRVAKVNRASPAASTLANGEAVSGRWWHETASLVHTPGDAGREWKLCRGGDPIGAYHERCFSYGLIF